ncbi:MAG TPA: glycine cleavage T C-terminal barrel domain-containing protein [Verrucomicrobiae bacterium]|nr:glycine cleavage T C-terminal barrel domain-containing protein [Verrucomicrobiae bacterium]
MITLNARELHARMGARFSSDTDVEVVEDYGDYLAEHAALSQRAALLDLSFRSRLCLTGGDRIRFLHGQVTNNVRDLSVGEGCYAALITPKGKMETDLNIYHLPNELLLDFEPGLASRVIQRLERYIIADDVQITEVASLYGLWSLQGPQTAEVFRQAALELDFPAKDHTFTTREHPVYGEIYAMNVARTGRVGLDFFIPILNFTAFGERLWEALALVQGRAAGWKALELARIEAGIPRYSRDMDETNLPGESGIESQAVSYSKGCYIGQEVIARIRTYGQVAKALRGLDLGAVPVAARKGDKLYYNGAEIGYLTSSIFSPTFARQLGLGYVRKEHNQVGKRLLLKTAAVEAPVRIVPLPFAAAELIG